jgi:hypothetical protein
MKGEWDICKYDKETSAFVQITSQRVDEVFLEILPS